MARIYADVSGYYCDECWAPTELPSGAAECEHCGAPISGHEYGPLHEEADEADEDDE